MLLRGRERERERERESGTERKSEREREVRECIVSQQRIGPSNLSSVASRSAVQ